MMDWNSSNGFGGMGQYYLNLPQYNMYPDNEPDMMDEEEGDTENDNFYGYDETDYPTEAAALSLAPAPMTSFTSTAQSAQVLPSTTGNTNTTNSILSPDGHGQEKKPMVAPTNTRQTPAIKQINEQKLAELRAKLMANRTATPGKDNGASSPTSALRKSNALLKVETPSRAETPSKIVNGNNTATPIKTVHSAKKDTAIVRTNVTTDSVNPVSGKNNTSSAIDDLLADGLAAAEKAQQEKDKQPTAPKITPNASFSNTNMPPKKNNSQATRIPSDKKKIKQDLPIVNGQNAASRANKLANQSTPAKDTDAIAPTMNTDRYDNRNRTSQNHSLTGPLETVTVSSAPNSKQVKQTSTNRAPSDPQKSNCNNATSLLRSSGDMRPPSKARPENSNTVKNDEYERDMKLWLEITGFHDKAFREQKLGTHKRRVKLEDRRRALEEEFAELERLEGVAAQEPNNVKYLRAQSVLEMAPPSQGVFTTTETAGQQSGVSSSATIAGIKRPLSPSNDSTQNQPGGKLSRLDTTGRSARTDVPTPLSATSMKNSNLRQQDSENSRTGYRIRGAVEDSPRNNLPDARNRMRSPSPSAGSLARRVFHPDRRSSFDEGLAIDRDRYNRANRGRDDYSLHQGHNFSPARGSFSSNSRGNGFVPRQGDRYFMIKSWNDENVIEAQERGYWCSQSKHTQLFEDAFRESRNVILLFSVNRSMAFQGAAIMTSPPDLRNPQPDFARKLNWKTSPSFSIRWITITPVHFRYVGHLKNVLNRDEITGEPRAVLVGRDGQEISEEAGAGVVRIMETTEADAAAGTPQGEF